MTIVIVATIILLLIIPLIVILIRNNALTPSEQILSDIIAERKRDEGIPKDFFKFIENNINDKNRYRIKNNIYE